MKRPDGNTQSLLKLLLKGTFRWKVLEREKKEVLDELKRKNPQQKTHKHLCQGWVGKKIGDGRKMG